jgi:preprotein translocase subunit SecY
MKIEIPLSFGRVRGYGIRWPLSFMYTSNIPVILIAALLSTLQLWARLLENWGYPLLGTFAGGSPATGLVTWLTNPNLVHKVITKSLTMSDMAHSGVYMLIMMGGSVLFSYFWVQTANMDAHSVAGQIMKSGLQVPGFRRDQRIMERLLDRYITPLTIMGAMTVGFLAAVADLTGTLTSGTGLLLTVMIIYKLYESIAKTHMEDMHPMLKKFVE